MYNFRLKGQLKTEVCFLIIGLVIHWFKLRDYKNSLQVVKPIYLKKERHAYSGTDTFFVIHKHIVHVYLK